MHSSEPKKEESPEIDDWKAATKSWTWDTAWDASILDKTEYTNEELLSALSKNLDKVSLRGLIKSFCLIDRQEEGTIYFVVLQKLQLSILQKQENLKAIEETLRLLLHKHVNVSMSYKSKDEYFSSLL